MEEKIDTLEGLEEAGESKEAPFAENGREEEESVLLSTEDTSGEKEISSCQEEAVLDEEEEKEDLREKGTNFYVMTEDMNPVGRISFKEDDARFIPHWVDRGDVDCRGIQGRGSLERDGGGDSLQEEMRKVAASLDPRFADVPHEPYTTAYPLGMGTLSARGRGEGGDRVSVRGVHKVSEDGRVLDESVTPPLPGMRERLMFTLKESVADFFAERRDAWVQRFSGFLLFVENKFRSGGKEDLRKKYRRGNIEDYDEVHPMSFRTRYWS